jgi:hypothetical protein
MRFIPFLQNFNNDEVSQMITSILPLIMIKTYPKNRFDWLLSTIILHNQQYKLYFAGDNAAFQIM